MNRAVDLFWQACHGSAPLRLSVRRQGEEAQRHQLFEIPFALLGRDAKTHLVLDDGEVSRRHAYVQMVAGQLFCVDLCSRTGTRWQHGAESSGWLDLRHVIRIGPFLIGCEGGPNGEATSVSFPEGWGPRASAFQPLQTRLDQAGDLPLVTLEFLQGAPPQTTCRLTRVLTLVGRSQACRVGLVDSSVSRFHCSLLRTPRGLWVIDLLGRSGISVNGEPVPWARLDDGDQLQVGRFLMKVRLEVPGPPAANPPSLAEAAGPAGWGENSLPLTMEELSPPAASRNEPGLPFPFPVSPPPPAPTVPSLKTSEVLQTSEVLGFGEGRVGVPVQRPGRAATVWAEQWPVPADWKQAFLVPLVQQFAVMQQEMFDQFQQAIMLMVQMFSALHKEQLALIREELDRLQELTRELHGLQAELAKAPRHTGGTGVSPETSFSSGLSEQHSPTSAANSDEVQNGAILAHPYRVAPTQELTDALPPGKAMDTTESLLFPKEAQPTAQPPLGGQECPPHLDQAQPTAGLTAQPPAKPTGGQDSAALAAEPSLSASNTDAVTPTYQSSPAEGAARPQPGPHKPEENIHALLYERIAAIQRERQTRFQRIVSYLLGK